MIEIYLLEQLAAFAQHGTLSKAAEALHISQPALSRSMKKIEEDLGVKLFVRESKKISLNETGQLAAALAQSQVNQNNEMIHRIIAFDRSLHSIRIGACTPQPMTDLMPILQDHFGDMTISSDLVYGEKLLNGMQNGAYQIGIVRAPIEDSGLFFQRYTEEHLYVVLPKEHRLVHKESVKFSDLAGEKFLLYQHIGFWKSVCEEYMSNTTFLIQPDRETFADLVMNTDYPAFSSDIIMDKQGVMKGRIAIPINEEKARYTFYIACRNEDKRKYASFFNSIRSEIINR